MNIEKCNMKFENKDYLLNIHDVYDEEDSSESLINYRSLDLHIGPFRNLKVRGWCSNSLFVILSIRAINQAARKRTKKRDGYDL